MIVLKSPQWWLDTASTTAPYETGVGSYSQTVFGGYSSEHQVPREAMLCVSM